MFVFLSKFLPPFFYPLGLAVIFILCAIFLKHKPRLQRIVLILALVVLLISSNRLVAAGLVRLLESQVPPAAELASLPAAPLREPLAPVIVLLGGGTESFSAPRGMVEVNGAGDRVLHALRLYRLGVAPKILVTGGNLDWSAESRSPAQDMADLLTFLGVPEQDIWLEGESRNTYENALYSQEILQAKGIQRIILVTSAQHMPRSLGLFAAQGLEVLPAPADFNLTDSAWQQVLHPRGVDFVFNLLPSASSLETTTNALKEYLGMLVYRLRGWMD
jgi:uncharacterized SAM-binding protein YcdF (DUF218 family)